MVAKRNNGFYTADVNVFSQMLVADSVRGIDGTGVFGIYGTGSVGWLKVGSHPYALLSNKKFESFAQAMVRKFDMVVGHNRKATAGESNNDNAHPFIHEHIILVHNGVVHNHKSMAETEVDSHAIAHSIVEKGHEETLAKLEGAFALVWFDMKDRILYMVRNSQRPLFLVETATQFVFASEGPMLTWLGDRNNNAEWHKAKQLEPGKLVAISQATKNMTTKTVKLYSFTQNWTPQHTNFMNDWESGAWPSSLDWPEATEDGSSSDPISEAIRNDLPEVSDEEIAYTEEFINKYGDGTTVTFEAKSMIPWNSSAIAIAGYNLEGTLRGNDDIAVRASFDGTNVYPMVKHFLDKRILKGTVYGAMINPSSGKRLLQVRHVISLDEYITFNGTKLTADEWVKIADSHRCSRCHEKIKIKDVDKTSVNIKNAENIRIFCPTCVKDHMSRLTPEHREKIKGINAAFGVILETTEDALDTKGATHGS